MKTKWNLKDLSEREIEASVKREGNSVRVQVDGVDYRFQLLNESDSHQVLASEQGERFGVRFSGNMMSYKTYDIALSQSIGARRKGRSHSDGGLVSPMPGKVFKVIAREGDQVEAGSILMILEAMKMEHSIKAPHAGVVGKIFYKEGDLVDGGVELATLTKARE